MKTTFICLVFLLIAPSIWGQTLVRKNWRYQLEDKPLSYKEVKQLYKSVPQALQQHKKAQLQFGISSGLLLVGGAYTGVRIGHLTATGELEFKQAGIGLGILALGFASSIGLNKKFDRAVTLYNQRKAKKTSFKWEPSQQGIGIKVSF